MSKKLTLGSFWPNFAQKRQNKISPLKKKIISPNFKTSFAAISCKKSEQFVNFP